jgi:hypothetical protein
MPNTKAVGVAYADPSFESVTVSGAVALRCKHLALISFYHRQTQAGDSCRCQRLSAGVYIFSTAITANSTTTSVPAGSLGITTNATGLGKLFYADGIKWQFMAIS